MSLKYLEDNHGASLICVTNLLCADQARIG